MGIGVRLQGTAQHGEQCLFDGLTLELVEEQWTCLLGPSGVGKSTLLRLIAGLPFSGKFDGTITAIQSGSDRPQGLEGHISYMAQSDLLFPWLNVKQNIMLGSRLRGDEGDDQTASQLIQRVGLNDHISKRPHQLSGGMRQRVALARTLMEDTPVVLLDEPFSALDARTRSDMQELAFEVLADKTVLLVTHEPGEAVRLSHKLYLMTENGLVEKSTISASPIRRVDDPDTLNAQAELLLDLKNLA